MKKSINIVIMLILLVLAITLSGCKKKNEKPVDSVKEPVKPTESLVKNEKDREKIMTEFDNVLNNKEIDKIISFIDANIGKLSPIEGDKMVSELENILQDSLGTVTNEVLQLKDTKNELISIAGTESFLSEDKIKDIQDENLRNKLTKIVNNKYKLVNVEGNYEPIIDYEKLKQYNNYISDEMKEYIEIKALDSNEPVAADGGLRISYDELGNRIIKTERYIGRYFQGQRYEAMLKSYKNKLAIYLGGLDNTPISDSETKKIYDDVLQSYNEIAKTKDSITGFVVSKYIEVIKENDNLVNKDVKDKVVSLVNEALSSLEVSK